MKPSLALLACLLAACGSATEPTPSQPGPPSGAACPAARPDFGVASAADRELFAYDTSAPLDLQVTTESTSNGIAVSAILPPRHSQSSWKWVR